MNDFFASIYEFFFYEASFSQAMYSHGLYSVLGLVTLLSALVLCLVFYYVINRPTFNLWYHWLLVAGVNACWAFLFALFYPRSPLASAGLEFGSQYFSLAVVNAILSFLMFVIFSFALRWWSRSARLTPIPH